MFYSIQFGNNLYLCSVIRENKNVKPLFKTWRAKKRKQIMKKNANEKIMMLQYRIKRYQAMGNGAMCQTLNGKLQKLLSQQVAM